MNPSGLKYRILRKGNGRGPTLRDKAELNYAAWFNNGRVFDTSYDIGQPQIVPMDVAILGLSEGLTMITEGGMIELEIPAKLAYGANGSGKKIPPNATLHYLVELIRVIPPPEPVVPGSADPDAPEEFTSTTSGLKYRILRKGNDKKPSLANKVRVHYRGWLDNGATFDSSYDRGEPASFVLSLVVPAWGEALPLVGEGGMIELEVPSHLGYGTKGSPPVIPPNATLHFLIELIDFEPLRK
ncbi:MAG: FKBP-type peptidyl-prolyl cis-trans isomerase [Planctomycetaceae bacterium]